MVGEETPQFECGVLIGWGEGGEMVNQVGVEIAVVGRRVPTRARLRIPVARQDTAVLAGLQRLGIVRFGGTIGGHGCALG